MSVLQVQDLSVALPVQLNLPRLVLHELRLVAPLDRAQFVGAPTREHPTGHPEREEPDDEQRPEDDVEQPYARKFFQHEEEIFSTERIESGVPTFER